jgi:hypothetical protein
VAVISPLASLMPLAVVIGVTAIKQAYEDYQVCRVETPSCGQCVDSVVV